VKLIDFGLASLKDAQDDDSPVGTQVFMAPETFISRGVSFTEEMDIWAIGVILTWMITAVELGSLQHPMLSKEQGEEFDVEWIHMYWAFRDKQPWNRSLIEDKHEGAAAILDQVLVYNPADRASASKILQSDWVTVDDPAAEAAGELFRSGALVENMKTYAKLSEFDRKILSLVADHAPDAQVRQLQRTFRALDSGNSGRISKEELVSGFEKNDVEVPSEYVEELFDQIDTDRSGCVSYHEWLAATIGTRILKSQRAIAAAFRRLDPEAKGEITKFDLERALGKDATHTLFESFDDDEPGTPSRTAATIKYEQFQQLVHKVAHKRSAVWLAVSSAGTKHFSSGTTRKF